MVRTRRWGLASGAAAVVLLAFVVSGFGRTPTPERLLRVCADPNNLPFSNDRTQGFENRLADLIASDLHARVAYTWWAQRRSYLRQTLTAGLCDVMPGV